MAAKNVGIYSAAFLNSTNTDLLVELRRALSAAFIWERHPWGQDVWMQLYNEIERIMRAKEEYDA